MYTQTHVMIIQTHTHTLCWPLCMSSVQRLCPLYTRTHMLYAFGHTRNTHT